MKPDAIVAQVGLRLPTGTHIIGASSSDDGDGLVRAKLEMPEAQVAGFVTSASIAAFQQTEPDLLGPDEGFWDPHRAEGPLRYGQTQLPGARFLHIAVDDGRPEAAVVSVMVHGT